MSLQWIDGWFDSSSLLSLSTPETTARESGGKLAEVLGVEVRTTLELVVVWVRAGRTGRKGRPVDRETILTGGGLGVVERYEDGTRVV